MTLTYRFDDGSRVGSDPPPGPYATLRIRVPTPAGPTALVAARPSRLARAGSRLVDASRAPPGRPAASPLCAAPRARLVDARAGRRRRSARLRVPRDADGAAPGPGFLLLLGCLFAFLLARPRHTPPCWRVYLSTGYLALFTAFRSFSHLDTVVYRPPNDDWFTYEAFAYSMLETSSPRREASASSSTSRSSATCASPATCSSATASSSSWPPRWPP